MVVIQMAIVLQAQDNYGWYTEQINNMDEAIAYLRHKVRGGVRLYIDGKDMGLIPNGIVRNRNGKVMFRLHTQKRR